MKRITSFDIFDTCLVRLCGTPSSFLDVLSTKVFTTNVDETTRQEFVVQRKRAERSLWGRPDANIFDIYNAFSYKHPDLIPVEQMPTIELSLEKDMLVPVLRIKKEIESIHNNGGNVLFISDMYIPGGFIAEILKEKGLYADGDKVFVSCDYGARKHDGELFKRIHKIEGIRYRDWIHKGDNPKGDYIQPKKLGIKAELVNNGYSPIQNKWQESSILTKYCYSGILAGLSRALAHSLSYTERRDFILDLIAPSYCAFVYKVLSDATANGLNRVFFCARDTYQMYRLALSMLPMFPLLEIKYLRISREALYEGNADLRIRYFLQEGLASRTEKCVIVDTTSSGKTVKFINEELRRLDYLPVSAYYFIKYDEQNIDMDDIAFNAVIKQYYVDGRKNLNLSIGSVLLLENYFSTNGDARTVDYTSDEKGVVSPIFSDGCSEQDAVHDDVIKWQEYEAAMLKEYSKKMAYLDLFKYAEQILESLAVPTLLEFLTIPNKFYLDALTKYKVNVRGYGLVPYVRKESYFHLLITRGADSGWKRGTVVYNVPEWFTRWYWGH